MGVVDRVSQRMTSSSRSRYPMPLTISTFWQGLSGTAAPPLLAAQSIALDPMKMAPSVPQLEKDEAQNLEAKPHSPHHRRLTVGIRSCTDLATLLENASGKGSRGLTRSQ